MTTEFYESIKQSLEQRFGKELIGFIQETVEKEVRQVLADSFDNYFKSAIEQYEITATFDKKSHTR
jgi:hypothetical protein